jgi:hypothetical protein
MTRSLHGRLHGLQCSSESTSKTSSSTNQLGSELFILSCATDPKNGFFVLYRSAVHDLLQPLTTSTHFKSFPPTSASHSLRAQIQKHGNTAARFQSPARWQACRHRPAFSTNSFSLVLLWSSAVQEGRFQRAFWPRIQRHNESSCSSHQSRTPIRGHTLQTQTLRTLQGTQTPHDNF